MNRVLRRVFGPKREEIRGWTQIRNGDACSTSGKKGNTGKPEGKTPGHGGDAMWCSGYSK